jgi:hypothetical protein
MAMEIFALSDRRLNSIAEWQRAIDAEGFPFPVRLSANRPFGEIRGLLPVQYDNSQSGFECDHWAPRSIEADYPNVALGHAWTYAMAFRFGINRGGLECAWMAAAAYARATNGVVFDTEEARVFQPEEAVQLVRKIEGNRAVRARIDEAVKRKLFPNTDV